MSRTALDKFPIGSVEKDYLLKLIKRFSRLYFTDSGIIGSKEFVSTHYQRFKHLFATKNKKLPKPVKGLSGMYSLKRLSEIL